LLAPREVILPTSHTSRAEGPRPTLPRARQASFPARPPWGSRPATRKERVQGEGGGRALGNFTEDAEGCIGGRTVGAPPAGWAPAPGDHLKPRWRPGPGAGALADPPHLRLGRPLRGWRLQHHPLLLPDLPHRRGPRPAGPGWDHRPGQPHLGRGLRSLDGLHHRPHPEPLRPPPALLPGRLRPDLPRLRAPLVCARLRERDGPVRL